MVSDDGDENYDPRKMGARAKGGKKSQGAGGKKKEPTKEELEEQIKKMETIEQ